MSNIVTYQSLQVDSLLTLNVDFSVMKDNFLIMNEFIKSFSTFQKKFIDMEKQQKSLKQEVSQFKMTTQSQLTTMNEILQSRGQISQGKSSTASQQINEIKKSIKQLKSFVTQSTRQQHQAQQIRQQQYETKTTQTKKQITLLKQHLQQSAVNIRNLQQKLQQLSLTTVKKQQFSQLSFNLQQQKSAASQLKQHVAQIDNILSNTKVDEFKNVIDKIDEFTKKEISDMRVKLSTRATVTDLLKLQQMMLNVNEYGIGEIQKIMANKNQTKKALLFLQKRINSLIVMTLGQTEDQRQGLITSKQIKCISCSKDLGQAEGKLDKVKNWSVFPAKQSVIKEKYAGFGAGFQTIIESTIAKKGGQVKYDEKGRMVEPFNLTGTIQGSLMRSSRSQHKIQLPDSKSKLMSNSPSKNSLKYETSFMHQYGRESHHQVGINITEEYYNRFRGLQSFVMTNKKNEDKQQK